MRALNSLRKTASEKQGGYREQDEGEKRQEANLPGNRQWGEWRDVAPRWPCKEQIHHVEEGQESRYETMVSAISNSPYFGLMTNRVKGLRFSTTVRRMAENRMGTPPSTTASKAI